MALPVVVGQTRSIILTGGGGMRETLTRVEAPNAFGYTLTDVKGAMAPVKPWALSRITCSAGRLARCDD